MTAFLRFGYVNYTPDTEVVRFIRGLREGKLYGTECVGCGEFYFPPRSDCGKCVKGDGMEWKEISGDAKLVTFSISQFAPKGFEKVVPYILAVGQLKEGPNVVAHLEGVEKEEIEIGMDIKLVVKEIGEDRYIYVFVPK